MHQLLPPFALNRATNDPRADHLLTFVMRYTLSLAVVGFVEALLLAEWDLGL